MSSNDGENSSSEGPNVIRKRRLTPREILTVRIESELREALKQAADAQGRSVSQVVRAALEQAVDSDVLQQAAERERIDALRRGLERDEQLLAEIGVNPNRDIASTPSWMARCGRRHDTAFRRR
jgi:predicted transcriptional regulator